MPRSAQQLRVRFGPREQRGLIAGWSSSKVLFLALSALLAIAEARLLPMAMGIAAALLTMVLALASVSIPIRGRSLQEWSPLGASFAVRKLLLRQKPFAVPVEHPLPIDYRPEATRMIAKALDLSGLSLDECELPGMGNVALAHDRKNHVVALSARLYSPGAALFAGAADPHMVEAWGQLLRNLGREGSPVAHFQWMSWAEEEPLNEVLLQRNALKRHSSLTIVVAYGRRARRRLPEAVALAAREILDCQRLLHEYGLELSQPSSLESLAPLFQLESQAHVFVWPLSLREHWDHLWIDSRVAIISWIEEWPRSDREQGFLTAMLMADASSRVTVSLRPVAPSLASRQLEQERTASIADEEIKRRGGFLSTMRRQREMEAAMFRERELADGETLFSFAGFVAATGKNLEEALASHARLEAAASRGGMVLRRLYGEQARAASTVFPLARGLAK